MSDHVQTPKIQEQQQLMIWLGWWAILGSVIAALSILVADFVVPDHDWIADTISDLGAGKFEFIVDIGLYAFSSSLLAISILSAHVHMGERRWSFGIVGFAMLALIVFLVGARNEYGDNDSDGVIIHSYLVYALGFLFAVLPWAMSKGARRVAEGYGTVLIVLSLIWTVTAPVFFFLPDSIDGIYERYLGVIAGLIVATLAWLFIQRGRKMT